MINDKCVFKFSHLKQSISFQCQTFAIDWIAWCQILQDCQRVRQCIFIVAQQKSHFASQNQALQKEAQFDLEWLEFGKIEEISIQKKFTALFFT